MRGNIQKSSSTKAERVFAEALKRHRIPFRFRDKVAGREVDFIVGSYAIEINGHPQSTRKNALLLSHGFTPINLPNDRVLKERDSLIQSLCLNSTIQSSQLSN